MTIKNYKQIPMNYKNNSSHMLIENIELSVRSISEANSLGFDKTVRAKDELEQNEAE